MPLTSRHGRLLQPHRFAPGHLSFVETGRSSPSRKMVQRQGVDLILKSLEPFPALALETSFPAGDFTRALLRRLHA